MSMHCFCKISNAMSKTDIFPGMENTAWTWKFSKILCCKIDGVAVILFLLSIQYMNPGSHH